MCRRSLLRFKDEQSQQSSVQEQNGTWSQVSKSSRACANWGLTVYVTFTVSSAATPFPIMPRHPQVIIQIIDAQRYVIGYFAHHYILQ